MCDKTPSTVSVYLGTGQIGRDRKDALKAIARKAGYFHNRKPSIGRWLKALADGIKTKPPPAPLSDEQLPVVAGMSPQELDDLQDAIHIARLRAMVQRLVNNGFEIVTGDSEDWAWTNYALIRDPAARERIFCVDLAELRVLLDTVREMHDPAAAFERWLLKVKAIADDE